MKTIYRFKDEGRGGTLSGVFIRDSYYVAEVLNRPERERTAFMGEILGKHSEVSLDLDSDRVQVVSNDPKDVEWFEKLFGSREGYDPFDYLEENLDL